MERIRIGCSGWNYKHWRELFYPKGLPASRWFAFYAEHFDTVEINNSFYRLPKAETFDAWREQAPPGFRYAVKANRFLRRPVRLCRVPVPAEAAQQVRPRRGQQVVRGQRHVRLFAEVLLPGQVEGIRLPGPQLPRVGLVPAHDHDAWLATGGQRAGWSLRAKSASWTDSSSHRR